jgi:fatty-acyl-CoA synthase
MTALSGLVAAAGDRARVVIGAGARPVTVSELAEVGDRRYRGHGGGALGIVMTNDRPTLECLFGALAAGTTLVSLPRPGRGAEQEWVAMVADAGERVGVTEIVARDDLAQVLTQAGAHGVRAHRELDARRLDVHVTGAFRLVQFSSGTTACPKAIALGDAALGRNVAAILDRVGPRAGDGVASWLPLSHDMGLIGMLLAGVAGLGEVPGGGEVVLVEPEWFLRSPGSWLRLVAEHATTVTAMPDFGLRLLTRRPSRDPHDLSTLRCVIVGGELVRAATLEAFARTYAPRGLRADALAPAYGLAELGLAATMTPPGAGWRRRALASDALAGGQVREVEEPGPDRVTLVAAGPPLAGYDVAAIGSPGAVDRVQVRGPSIGVDGVTGASFAGPDGWCATGDRGFVDGDGWVTICGRMDDRLVVHGRYVDAPAVEAAVCGTAGVRDGRAAAVGLPTGEWVILVETNRSRLAPSPEGDRVRNEVRRRAVAVAGVQPDDVWCVPTGTLPFTSSGKLQRHRLGAVVAGDRASRPVAAATGGGS